MSEAGFQLAALSYRQAKHQFNSEGLTPEGERIRADARAKAACPHCGAPVPRRQTFCEGEWPDGCRFRFNEAFRRDWNDVKRAVARRAAGRCEKCQFSPFKEPATEWQRTTLGGRFFEFDHIAEVAAGGDPLAVKNVQMLCRPCHKEKTRRYNQRAKHIASAGGVIVAPAAPPLERFETGSGTPPPT
jgi:hypothetical protein